MRSRPLVTGDSAVASHRARPLPICSAGGSRDPGEVVAAGLVTFGPCRPGPAPAEPARGSANVKIAQGREPGGKPPENRNRAAAEGTEPENAGRRETGDGGRRGEPGGQTGNRRKARRETGGRAVRPQTTRCEPGDLGPHASAMPLAESRQVCANCALSSSSVLAGNSRHVSRAPQTLHSPRTRQPAPSAVC